jgi:hypothetical protein
MKKQDFTEMNSSVMMFFGSSLFGAFVYGALDGTLVQHPVNFSLAGVSGVFLFLVGLMRRYWR